MQAVSQHKSVNWSQSKHFLVHNPHLSFCQTFSRDNSYTYFMVRENGKFIRLTLKNGALIQKEYDN